MLSPMTTTTWNRKYIEMTYDHINKYFKYLSISTNLQNLRLKSKDIYLHRHHVHLDNEQKCQNK
jgi:hypothetical protein